MAIKEITLQEIEKANDSLKNNWTSYDEGKID